jgi:hypothetical protein
VNQDLTQVVVTALANPVELRLTAGHSFQSRASRFRMRGVRSSSAFSSISGILSPAWPGSSRISDHAPEGRHAAEPADHVDRPGGMWRSVLSWS